MKKLLSLMLMLALLVLVTSNATAQEPVGGGEEVEDATEEVVEEVEESVGEPVEEPVSEDAGEAVEEAVEEEVEGVGETVSEPVDDNGEEVEEFEPVGDPGELSAAQLDDGEPDLDAQLASGWVSVFQIINGGTSNANVTINFYQEGSTTAAPTTSRQINPGDVVRISADDGALGLSDNWRGSVIVESDQSVGVAVRQSINSGTRFAGSYAGISTAGSTVYLPSVLRDYFGYENTIAIQGVSGSDDTIEFTLTVYNEDGTVADTIPGTVGVNTGTYLDLSGDTGSDLGNGFIGSAAVTTDNGSDTVAVVVVQENPGGFTQSYEGFTSGVRTLYAAGLYDEFFEFISSINVQNVSDDCTGQVTVQYAGQGVNKTNEFTLPPKIGRLVLQPGDDLNEGQPGNRWAGSATITSECDIVAVVNAATVNRSGTYPNASDFNQAQTYSAVATGAKSVAVPMLEKLVDGRFSSITVQNIGTASASYTVNYSDGTSVTSSEPLGVGESAIVVLGPDNNDVNTGFNGGAIVSSASDIAVVVNQGATVDALNAAEGDQSISYNGSALQ